MGTISHEIIIVLLLLTLFILPKIMIRIGLPSPITSLMLGILIGPLLFASQEFGYLQVLATIGISSLFLFAGLEINFEELKNQKTVLLQHVLIRGCLWLMVSTALFHIFELTFQAAGISALALISPSAGFILDQLSAGEHNGQQRAWIRNLVIAAEIFALLLMFVLLKSGSAFEIGLSLLILIALAIVLPLLFKGFIRYIAPYAPDSEFSFLIIMSIAAGLITKKLGTYYLIGAFVVGVTAQYFQSMLPNFSSRSMLKSLKMFAGFFMPFYFFYSGSRLPSDMFSGFAWLWGINFIVIIATIRVLVIVIHRKISLKEQFFNSFQIAVSLLPNLVFGLILVNILISEKLIPDFLAGALIIYSVGVTLMPTIIARISGKNIKPNEVEFNLDDGATINTKG